MKRLTALVVLVGVAGCQTPTNLSIPSMNMLAPYGTTRVPPPSTGSFDKPNTYYQPPTQSGLSAIPTEATGEPTTNTGPSSPETIRLTSAETDPRQSSGGVQTAAGSSPTNTTGPRIIESKNATSALASRLKGMHVNDGTRLDEPRTLEQIPDLSQLPQPPATASAAGSQRTVTPAPTAAGSPTSTSNAAGWEIREGTGRSLRVAER